MEQGRQHMLHCSLCSWCPLLLAVMPCCAHPLEGWTLCDVLAGFLFTVLTLSLLSLSRTIICCAWSLPRGSVLSGGQASNDCPAPLCCPPLFPCLPPHRTPEALALSRSQVKLFPRLTSHIAGVTSHTPHPKERPSHPFRKASSCSSVPRTPPKQRNIQFR